MKQVIKCEYQQVRVSLEPKVVRIDNYEPLETYLIDHKSAMAMAKGIKDKYYTTFNQPLAISTKSLASEIKGHYLMKKYCLLLQDKCPKLTNQPLIKRIINRLLLSCDVIDCGELSEDNNRWVWDILQIFE
ncbi:MAG: hypothetical protein HUJ56_04690 [Erysipelotrichaceae bacterium]|nr:hypothetical protein [Erysipelotrichaceae bacterium]